MTGKADLPEISAFFQEWTQAMAQVSGGFTVLYDASHMQTLSKDWMVKFAYIRTTLLQTKLSGMAEVFLPPLAKNIKSSPVKKIFTNRSDAEAWLDTIGQPHNGTIMKTRNNTTTRWQGPILKLTSQYLLIGGITGYLVVHPLVMMASHLMFDSGSRHAHALPEILLAEILTAFSITMLAWGIAFALSGACIGYLYGKVKQKEQALREANAGKDKFFFILAHDLRNPLHVALLNLEMLLNNYDRLDHEHKKSYLQSIYEYSERASALVEDVLTWAQTTHAGKMSWNPQELVLAAMTAATIFVLRAQAANKQITLHETIPDNTRVYGDVNMVAAVMRNLVANAIKFTPEGGKVTITSHNEGKFETISVSDTGIGMSAEQLQRLFHIEQPLFTPGMAHERGAELGLLLCKEFVERNGGEIWVESEVGKGSIFTFTLPRFK